MYHVKNKTRICAAEMAVRYAALSACRKVHFVCHCNSLGGATWRSVTITGRTDRQTDIQTDRRTDRVRRIMRPPPREEGRIIIQHLRKRLVQCRTLASFIFWVKLGIKSGIKRKLGVMFSLESRDYLCPLYSVARDTYLCGCSSGSDVTAVRLLTTQTVHRCRNR